LLAPSASMEQHHRAAPVGKRGITPPGHAAGCYLRAPVRWLARFVTPGWPGPWRAAIMSTARNGSVTSGISASGDFRAAPAAMLPPMSSRRAAPVSGSLQRLKFQYNDNVVPAIANLQIRYSSRRMLSRPAARLRAAYQGTDPVLKFSRKVRPKRSIKSPVRIKLRTRMSSRVNLNLTSRLLLRTFKWSPRQRPPPSMQRSDLTRCSADRNGSLSAPPAPLRLVSQRRTTLRRANISGMRLLTVGDLSHLNFDMKRARPETATRPAPRPFEVCSGHKGHGPHRIPPPIPRQSG
jgi:hypothetical protein